MVRTHRIFSKSAAAALTPLLIFAAPASAAEVVDGSFETQGSSSPPLCFFGVDCAPGAWSGNGRSGIDTNGGPYGGSSPEGNKFAFIQSFNGGFGSVSQALDFDAGKYELSFLVGGRANTGCCNGNTSYSVFLDDEMIYSGATTSDMAFTKQTALFSTAAGSRILTFRTVAAQGDNTAFIDAVSVNAAVPEPGTWAMMLLGFGFVGGAMRSAKRRQKVTVSYA